MTESKLNMFGQVGVQPLGGLADTARVLGEVLGGLSFVEDLSSRYDEYPAYIAERDGLRYALLGTPAPGDDLRESPSNDFALLVEPVTRRSGLPNGDASEELIKRITLDGRISCWPLK